ncbi:3-oxoacyl-[acyl-carrier-protein] reductase [Paenibacillus ferrarius]|uniref:3-oxoacyl-[acyl-carrier-protein] reductase n=1 Tax=Paenibacillus ferrarius TaxID=1469647 RepID=A0A1V4HQE2_9BACL|nr:SDR family NAD(P)-dependent oxidoreductase [Paenibacillus ferrarius]OPH60311.1 3-oxoacyl-[acyl-carrier-protein] reductase [Paenibacillus ferrarius]
MTNFDHSQTQPSADSGKVAIVTGAASGIGLASAIRLAEKGFKIGLLNRPGSELDEAVEKITASGGEAIALPADIAFEEQVKQAIQTVMGHWGRLDVLVANAGINGVLSPIADLELDDWNATININLTGTFLCVKYAVEPLKQQGGSIIITSSINGNRVFSNFGMSAYSTSKAGQVAFMKMAALELARYKIRVNAICPGAIHTNIDENTDRRPELEEITIPIEYPEGDQPLEHKPGTAGQVANLVLFLASDQSDHITGTSVYIDGAESLIHG